MAGRPIEGRSMRRNTSMMRGEMRGEMRIQAAMDKGRRGGEQASESPWWEVPTEVDRRGSRRAVTSGAILTIDRARHGTNPNEPRDVRAIPQHRACEAHGLQEPVERRVLGVVTDAGQPLISFVPGDGGVIGLPHRTHELHEDRTPPILENGYGTGHMSHMFEGGVGG
ncbi:unnamed protein product [Sphagnum compactum]